MRSSLTPLGPTVSRDRIITCFPKWYTPNACLQLKEHFHGQVNAACQRRNTGTVGLSLSKVVVVGDLYVGKTSLIHRFCKNVFDHDYKATIGVDFEIERFEIVGIPYSLQIWDTAGQEKFKCIASAYYRGAQGEQRVMSGAACEQAEVEAMHLANEMQAEYWSVSAKTGENVKPFFSRVAALAFEQSVLRDLERRSSARLQVGNGDLIRAYRPPDGMGSGAGEQACGLKPTSATLPSPSLGCASSHHSDLGPAASLTPPGSVASPPDCPCPPGSLLMGRAGHSSHQGCVPALALLVPACAHSVPPPGMRPGARP
ncbi:Ras-related protein Rab-36 [Pteropus alecto]|uniref:Ras-related protein Rab-36 n=1 Tax=Pteropus alecto TaxID=9402 RepID=L5KXT4_PTEAL|nr:Ras-related protein Rab-36 [Pteropus alecto]